MAKIIGRYVLRIAMLAIAASLVVAAAYKVTPSHDPKPAEAAEMGRAKSRSPANEIDVPTPGSETALRQVIEEISHGSPHYERMSEEASDALRQRLQVDMQLLASLGPLNSIEYLGADKNSDVYRVTLRNGSLLWKITMGTGGRIEGLHFAAPEGPTPQDWIDNYALATSGKDMARIALALVKFLAIVGVGRFAGVRL